MRPRDKLSLLLPVAYVCVRYLAARTLAGTPAAAAVGAGIGAVFLLASALLCPELSDEVRPALNAPGPLTAALTVMLAAAGYAAAVRLAVPAGDVLPPGPLAMADIWLLGPLAEEALYRGGLYRTLKRLAPTVPAALFSAALFAAAHGSTLQALLAFPFGLLSVTVLELTGTLRASAALHCGYNLLTDILACAGAAGTSLAAFSAGCCLLCVLLCLFRTSPFILIEKRTD